MRRAGRLRKIEENRKKWLKKVSKNKVQPLAGKRKLLYTTRDASVAQWIEQWPPEPRAEVRFLSDAFFVARITLLH